MINHSNPADSNSQTIAYGNDTKDSSSVVTNADPVLTTHVAQTNVKSLKDISTNFQSAVNKVPLLLEVISKQNPDIILGSETWLTASITPSEIFPPNHNVFRKDRMTLETLYVSSQDVVECLLHVETLLIVKN